MEAQKISIKEVSKILGASDQLVRVGMQRGLLPIGVAVQITNNNYTYHVSRKLLEEYIGKEVVDNFYEDRKEK